MKNKTKLSVIADLLDRGAIGLPEGLKLMNLSARYRYKGYSSAQIAGIIQNKVELQLVYTEKSKNEVKVITNKRSKK